MAAPPVFERRPYIDKVKRALIPLDRSHGALQESVVLWGDAGVGKSDIALQAAREIGAIDGRMLLVVDGSTFANLTSTYLAAFITFTGSELSRADCTLFVVTRIRLCLEHRRREWLMVVLDMALCTETFCNGSREFPCFLPRRGQLIFTTTTIARQCNPPALQNAVNPTNIYVPGLSATGVRIYARTHCPELLHMSQDADGLLDLDCISPVDLNIIAANIRLLRCSYPHYVSYFSSRAAVCTRSPSFTAWKIHGQILWDLLTEYDRWATRLLSALAFLNPWGIPTAAIEELPMFKITISDRLNPALDLLHSLHIVTIDAGHVSLHPRLHVWLRHYALQKCPPKDWAALLNGWNAIMADACAPYQSQHPFRYLSLGAHALSLSTFLDVAKLSYTSTALIVLTAAAQLPYITHTEFQSLLHDAYRISGSVLARYHTASFGNYFMAKVRLAKARRYIHLQEVEGAGLELRAALPFMYRVEDDVDYNNLLELSWELQARKHITEGNFSTAERFLRDLFANKLDYARHRTRTRRLLYHLMAKALQNQGKFLDALKYSHAAMFYFGYQYKPDGRPRRLRTSAEVVDLHITLLFKFQKYRGALLYLVPTIEEMLLQPDRRSVILDYAYQAVHCYKKIGNLNEAERLVIRILEADLSGDGGIREGRSYFIADELQDDDLGYYMVMFEDLGQLYCSHGRFVEADALCRYQIAVELHRFPGFRPPRAADYQGLILLSYARGNYSMVDRLRADLKAIHDETYTEEECDRLLANYRRTKDTYQRALWAAQDGCYGDSWNTLSASARDDLCMAERHWGKVETRLSEGSDFASNLDEGGISHARKSKLLHLIGYDLVDLAFVSKLYPHLPSSLQNNKGEHVEIHPGLKPRVSEEPPPKAASSSAGLYEKFEKDIGEGGTRVGPVPSTNAPNDDGQANEERLEVAETSVPVAGEEPGEDTTNRHHPKSEVKADRVLTHDTVVSSAPTTDRNDVEETSLPAAFVRGRQPAARLYDRSAAAAQDFRLTIIDLWSDARYQRTIPEYWPWCYCRRHRTRSSSINPIDLISKRFIRESAHRSASPRPETHLIQKKITDCFIVIPPEPNPWPPGCHDQCPCIKANEDGALEWSSYEDNFMSWPSDAPYQARWPSDSPCHPVVVGTGRPGPPGRFISPYRPRRTLPPGWLFTCVDVVQDAELDEEAWDAVLVEMKKQDSSEPLLAAVNVDPARPMPLGTTWLFQHAEFTDNVEQQGETYIVTFALDMPKLTITLAEDEWSLPVPGRERFSWKEVEEDVLVARGLVHDVVEGGGEVEACAQVQGREGDPEWIKYTKGDAKWTGTYWILTKRKEFLTEYFERGAFGPSQRVRSERKLQDMWHPIEPGMKAIEEEEEDDDDDDDEDDDYDEAAQDADSGVDWEQHGGEDEGDAERIEQPCPGFADYADR